jgi:hypothetical protein
MPMLASGLVEVPSLLTMSLLDVAEVPFHLVAGTPMATPSWFWVPEVGSRWKMKVSSVQGATPEALPKPNTK